IARVHGVLRDARKRGVVGGLARAGFIRALQELGDLLGGDVALERGVVADVHRQQTLLYVVAAVLVAAAAGDHEDFAGLAGGLYGRADADILAVPDADRAAQVRMLLQ